jgi:hypothetical protein
MEFRVVFAPQILSIYEIAIQIQKQTSDIVYIYDDDIGITDSLEKLLGFVPKRKEFIYGFGGYLYRNRTSYYYIFNHDVINSLP